MVDDAGGRFSVDLLTGEVTVAAGADLDFEAISSHTISVRATSEDGSQVDQTFTITILDENESPEAIGESYETTAGTPLVVAPTSVLGNDTDVDGDVLTSVLQSGPANGTLSINPNGTFTYTPNSGFFGVDSFTYVASDGELNSNLVTVTITVVAVNDGGGDGGGDGGNGGDSSGTGGDTDSDAGTPAGVTPIDRDEDDGHNNRRSTNSVTVEGGVIQLDSLDGSEGGVQSANGVQGGRTGSLAGILGALQTESVDSTVLGSFATDLLLSNGWDLQSAFVWDAVVEDSDITDDEEEFSFLIDSASTAAGLFSIGLVVWVLRGGAFMTALASGGSSWRIVDPTAMLSAYRGGGSGKSSGGGIDSMMD